MNKIVVDLLGADKSEVDLLEGAIKAINEDPDLKVCLCGYKSEIEEHLNKYAFNSQQLEIIDSLEEVTNLDSPSRAFKQKPNSSLILGLKKCKEEDDVKGFVSFGATGAVMVSSMFIVGRMEQISRPTLSSMLLDEKGNNFCIVDCGANVDCKVEHLLDFAKMGVAFMKTNGVRNPRVALLSNGKEEKKGNELVKEAHQLFLKQDFNFVGNIEGNRVLSGDCDVVVCDGFSGNILLKTIEGAAKTVFMDLVNIAKHSSKDEANILMDSVKNLLNKYDYNSKGGAILLGINKVLVKGHGGANSETVYNCIRIANELVKNELVEKIKSMY